MIVSHEITNRIAQLSVDASRCLRYAFNTESPYDEEEAPKQLEFYLQAVINQATEILEELKEEHNSGR